MTSATNELIINLPLPHERQREFMISKAKRKVIRAGRRSGKTVGVATYAVEQFLDGRRVLYATPTSEQIDRFWKTVTHSLAQPIEANIFYKNETEHVIERLGTEQRIRAKTAWNADSLRGDYADLLILDEWQLMNEDAWGVVGAPMLLDNNGDAIFIYTPPSLHSRSVSKANDPQHAAKLFKRASADTTGRWETFHFTSKDNPHISEEALQEITGDMTQLSYRQEILAEDVEEAPGALWHYKNIDDNRVVSTPELDRIVVAIDPSATSTGDEAGIIVAGNKGDHFYPLADETVQGSPYTWARAAVTAYHKFQADCIVAEKNNGGEMVELTIRTIPEARGINIKLVTATRGKQTRAEPIAAVYEQGRGHHVGVFPMLEDELVMWTPGDNSPNRLDALVWAGYELGLGDYVNPADLVDFA